MRATCPDLTVRHFTTNHLFLLDESRESACTFSSTSAFLKQAGRQAGRQMHLDRLRVTASSFGTELLQTDGTSEIWCAE